METNSKFLNIYNLIIGLIQLYNFKSILVDDYTITRESSCLLCDQPAGSEGLHETATKQLGKKVSECACELRDTALLAKLAAGDMIAIESKYHNRCLCALHNRARLAPPMDNDGVEACMHGKAFAELVVFLENASSDENSLLSSDSGTLLNCISSNTTPFSNCLKIMILISYVQSLASFKQKSFYRMKIV